MSSLIGCDAGQGLNVDAWRKARSAHLWGLSRATLHRQRMRQAANDPRTPRRRGPQGAAGDTDLLAAIREVIEVSPFTGKGYRKV
ncbi:hypothetical protein LV780_20960 (plasmid) [Cereibacter azotoformans]|uniref:hypothetical protein n=1 Tax=Cereibacter azotoformans TaxID=43057 RepID=UPI0015F31D3C|nr:hypothetical protein [Cereibacter azotoformans]MBO4169258.1 hypothetical protein [Cereibacter azotoformans]UIJ31353.1 hypothetical protein LV780_04020 [Cereibacter azotoformans]UIJ33212.1 hypothetical protein LV780_20960 [Cereibacter azotoformans]